MTFTISDPRLIVRANDVLVAEETLKVGHNGYFDARLIRRAGGVFDIEVFMKLQFFFVDAKDWIIEIMQWEFEDDDERIWAQAERHDYMRKWHKLIRSTWNRMHAGRIGHSPDMKLGTFVHPEELGQTRPVNVTFNFFIQEAGWMQDHFEIEVFKAPDGIVSGFGSVERRRDLLDQVLYDADVEIDSNSLAPRSEKQAEMIREKSGVPAEAGYTTAAHEFGHMIGLDEDYANPIYSHDPCSVMHHGPDVYPRHYRLLLSWADAKLKRSG